ncbi:hypothetical protein EES41_26800 [Streptomyces sp. ADI95-16]|nr:hypothetical protein EES41_26800 [Streptomyces sp. ADI95-16]
MFGMGQRYLAPAARTRRGAGRGGMPPRPLNTPPGSCPTAVEAVRDGGIAYGPAIAVRVTEG